MSYSPPAPTAVDFELETYSPPAPTAVDFELGAVTISPGAVTLTLSNPEPAVGGTGTVTTAAPVTTLTATTNAPGLAYALTPSVTTLGLDAPEPGVTAVGAVAVSTSVTTLSLDDPTPDVGFFYWLIDGTPIDQHVAESRDWQTLQIVFRVDNDTLVNDLSPLKDTAEKLEVVAASDGSFTTLDRAATDGVYTLKPPVGRDPPRTDRDYLVGQYRQRPIDQDVASHEVQVAFVAKENREPDGTAPSETRASDEWSFAFRSATIATKRVQAEIREGTDTAAETVDLTLVLDATQTKVVEESATRLAAVSTREVPDGANTWDDDSDGPTDANTVTVTTPDGETPIPDGDYVVTRWSDEWLSNRAYRISMTLGKP